MLCQSDFTLALGAAVGVAAGPQDQPSPGTCAAVALQELESSRSPVHLLTEPGQRTVTGDRQRDMTPGHQTRQQVAGRRVCMDTFPSSTNVSPLSSPRCAASFLGEGWASWATLPRPRGITEFSSWELKGTAPRGPEAQQKHGSVTSPARCQGEQRGLLVG